MVPSRTASTKADFIIPIWRSRELSQTSAPLLQKLYSVYSSVWRGTLTTGCHKCSAPAQLHLVGSQSPVKHWLQGLAGLGTAQCTKLLLQESFYQKMCTHQRVCGALCARERILSSRQIRRPEERNFKPLCIYYINSCYKTWTETPTVILVEVFKVCG